MGDIDFLQYVVKLKGVKRTGWLYKDIPDSESIADHSFGVAMLALIVPLPKNIDRDDLVKMALLNELRDLKTGEIVWEKGVHANLIRHKKKVNSQKNIISKLFGIIDNKKLKRLAIEYLEQKTKIARFLRELSKLEMVLQALEYEKRVHPYKLNEFWINADKCIKDDVLREYFLKLKSKRAMIK